jgi:hypothetical protein
MSSSRRNNIVEQQEPMGIVISRGSRDEAQPKLWAYVWAPAPEETRETVETRAA